MAIKLQYVLLLIALLVLEGEPSETEAKYHDIRCRCQCKEYPKFELQPTVYTTNLTQESCRCEMQLKRVNFTNKLIIDEYCLGCECTYEVRSMITMKVVVIIYICLIFILFGYMLFTWIAEMVNRSKQSSIQSERSQLVNNRPMSSNQEDIRLRRASHQSNSSSIGQRLTSAQSEWKRQLKSQRDKVFRSRNILQ